MANTFVSDTMTGTNWQDLHLLPSGNGHRGEIGGVWTRHASTPSSRWYIFNNKVHCGVAGLLYASGVPANADVTVECDYTMYTDIAAIGIAARVSLAALTFYYVYYNAGELVLAKQINGSITTLGTNATGLMTNGNTYRLKLECIGTAIKAYVNGGAAAVSATDSGITAAGYVGVRSPTANDAGTGKHIDNYIAYDSSTAAVAQARFAGIVG
jgi:hypothetical protein